MALLFLSATAWSQPLRDINYAYLYNPDELFSFSVRPVRGSESFAIVYTLQVKDTAGLMNEYSIHWEGRTMLNDKEGTPIVMEDHVIAHNSSGFQGRATIRVADAPPFIVARVTKNSLKRAWLFYTPLEQNFPANNYFTRNGLAVMDPYIRAGEKVRLAYDSLDWIVSYYRDDFPAAAPAFSEALAKVSRGMIIDSVYSIRGGEEVDFSGKGLYLIQKDTTSLQGLSFRVEEDYPQYSKLVNLPGPLIYITTKQEFDRLELSRGNKRAFDRVILSMTADTERARIFMRSYFRRVELANRYFTSYKEGWKTDRGMIYIIFGRPDEVFKFNDREVWNYKSDRFEIGFTFSKSSSLFDPDNFVLIREKKYENTWYEVIDLWRNARF
jgi:GWxTD domain-containing protein